VIPAERSARSAGLKTTQTGDAFLPEASSSTPTEEKTRDDGHTEGWGPTFHVSAGPSASDAKYVCKYVDDVVNNCFVVSDPTPKVPVYDSMSSAQPVVQSLLNVVDVSAVARSRALVASHCLENAVDAVCDVDSFGEPVLPLLKRKYVSPVPHDGQYLGPVYGPDECSAMYECDEVSGYAKLYSRFKHDPIRYSDLQQYIARSDCLQILMKYGLPDNFQFEDLVEHDKKDGNIDRDFYGKEVIYLSQTECEYVCPIHSLYFVRTISKPVVYPPPCLQSSCSLFVSREAFVFGVQFFKDLATSGRRVEAQAYSHWKMNSSLRRAVPPAGAAPDLPWSFSEHSIEDDVIPCSVPPPLVDPDEVKIDSASFSDDDEKDDGGFGAKAAAAAAGVAAPGLWEKIKGLASKISSFANCVEHVQGLIASLQTILSNIAEFVNNWKLPLKFLACLVCCLFVKKLIKLGYDVVEFVSLCVSSIIDADLSECLKKAFSLFHITKKEEEKKFNVVERDGKMEFVESDVSFNFPSKKVVEAQSAMSVTAILAGAMAFVTPAAKSKSLIERVVDAAKVVTPLVAAGGVGASALLHLFSKLPAKYADMVYGVFGYDAVFASSDMAKQVVRRATELLCFYNEVEGADRFDAARGRELIAVYSALLHLREVEPGFMKPGVQRQLYESLLRDIKPLAAAAAVNLGGSPLRRCPVGFYVYGSSGIGKSSLMSQLAKLLYPNQDPHTIHYAKNVNDKYWSGYGAQKIITLDDYGCSNDDDAKKFNGELITILSNNKLSFAMAEASQKGSVLCCAEYVGLSTNVSPLIQVPGIFSQEAFHRRFIFVHAHLVPGFATAEGRLDTERLVGLSANDQASFPHLRFTIEKVAGPRIVSVSRQYSLAELATVLRAANEFAERDYLALIAASREGVPAPLPPDEALEVYLATQRANINAGAAGQRRVIRQMMEEPVEKKHGEVDVLVDGDLPESSLIVAVHGVLQGIHEKCGLNCSNIASVATEIGALVPISIQHTVRVLGGKVNIVNGKSSVCVGSISGKQVLITAIPEKVCDFLDFEVCSSNKIARVLKYIKDDCVAIPEARTKVMAMMGLGPKGRVSDFALIVKLSVIHMGKGSFGFLDFTSRDNAYDVAVELLARVDGQLIDDRRQAIAVEEVKKNMKPSGWAKVWSLFSKAGFTETFEALCKLKPSANPEEAFCKALQVKPWAFSLVIQVLIGVTGGLVFSKAMGFWMRVCQGKAVDGYCKKYGMEPVTWDQISVAISRRPPHEMIQRGIPAEEVRSHIVDGTYQSWCWTVAQSHEDNDKRDYADRFDGRFDARRNRDERDPRDEEHRTRGKFKTTKAYEDDMGYKHPAVRRFHESQEREADRESRGVRHALQREDYEARFHEPRGYAAAIMRDYDFPEGGPLNMGPIPGRRVEGQAADEVMQKISMNQIKITMTVGGVSRSIYGLGVSGCLAVFPAHFFLARAEDGHVGVIIEDCPLELLLKCTSRSLRYDHKRLFHLMDKDKHFDLVGYDFTGQTCCFADIVKHFKDFDEVKSNYSTMAEFVRFDGTHSTESAQLVLAREYYSCDNSQTSECYVSNFWSYSGKVKGDCGLVLYSPSLRCILGMHTATIFWGNSDQKDAGISVRIDRSALQQFLSRCDKLVVSQQSVECRYLEPTEKNACGDSFLVGELTKVPFSPSTTDYRPLPYQGEDWCPKGLYGPAVLGPRHPINPGHARGPIAVKALTKLCRKSKEFPSKLVGLALEDLKDLYTSFEPFRPPQLLSQEEAINGGLPSLRSIPMKTSAGFPYNMRKPAGESGKSWMFTKEIPRKIIDTELVDDLNESLELLEQGVMPAWIADYNLKDELRPMPRVMSETTRGVMASAVCETLIFRTYFGDFINFVHSHFIDLEVCIGMNVFSSQWQYMINKLKRNSNKGFATDYSGAESFGTPQIAGVFADMVNHWYRIKNPATSDIDCLIRRRLMYVLCFHYVRLGNKVYMKPGHNMSGSVLTGVFNSFMVQMHWRMAFLGLSQIHDPKFFDLSLFKKFVALVVYGDDNMCTVSERVGWYNALNLGNWLGDFGIVLTPADKNAELSEDLTDLCRLSFLKCTTMEILMSPVQGVHLFPEVDEESLIKSCSWWGSTLNKTQAVVVIGNDTLCRVWPSGPERFIKWRQRIRAVWKEYGIIEEPITYQGVLTRWETGTMPVWAYSETEEQDKSGPEWAVYQPEVCIKRVISQMLASSAEPTGTVPEPAASTMAANEEKKVPNIAAYDTYEMSVIDLLKRYHPVAYYDNPSDLAFSLSSVFSGLVADNFPPSLIQYYARMFRGFIGNLRFKVISADGGDAIYSASFSSSPVVQKRVLYRATTTTMEPGPVAIQKGVLEVQTPFNSMFTMCVVPNTRAETTYDTSNFGYVVFSGLTDHGVIYCCLGDGARFFNLCAIPRLSLVANNYPHDGSPTVNVAQYLQLTHDPSQPDYDFTQEVLNSWQATATIPTTQGQIGEMKMLSSNVSDSVLRTVFGYAISPGQPRNILVGDTLTVSVDLTDVWAVYAAVPIITGPVDAFPSLSMPFVSLNPTVYSFVNSSGQPEMSGNMFGYVNDYDNASVRQTLGIPSNVTYVSTGSNGPEVTARVGPTSTDPGLPYSRNIVSLNPLWSLYNADLKEDLPVLVHRIESQMLGFSMPKQTVLVSAGSLPDDAKMITIGEESPDLTQLTQRPQFLSTTLWDSSQVAGTVIASFEVPFALLNSKAMAPAWAGSVFWRGTPRVMLQLQSNQFSAGCLIVVWCPLMDAATASQVYGGRLGSSNLARFMKMYPNTNPTIEFEIPFFYPQTHMDTRQSSNFLGTLIVMVHNALSVGPSAPVTSIPLTAYASFKESEFAVLNPKTVVSQGGVQAKYYSTSNTTNIEHVVSSVIDVPNSTSDSFAGGATDLKMPAKADKPNVCITPMPLVSRILGNLANNVDIEYAQNLDLPAASVPMVSTSVAGLAFDEMSISRMQKMPGYITTFQVTASQITNDVLYTGDLCPCAEFFGLAAGSTFDLSLLSYASLPFSYWQGDLVVDLEVIGTAFHICKLAICSHYGFEAAGLTVEESMGQYTTVFDVNGYATLKVVFPWRSPTPWKKVCNGTYADASPFSMGQFSVRLLSPLQYNETVASSIDVNLYLSGGQNFRTTFVGNNAIDVAPVDLT
jgi:hypothetical protein